MRRFLSVLLCAVFLLVQIPTVRAAEISAASYVLMDADSGRVLREKDGDHRRLIASITKLMTALVALESGQRLEEEVTVAPEWAGVEGSSIYLMPGEKVSLETLLYGMLLRSGNDAAMAVAGSCGGTVEEFVAAMNRKAAVLGMTNTHFANPNGLNAEDHYSTARDMALLARACLQNEALAQMVSTKSIKLGTRVFTNHNKLLWRYPGCIGMKTGYTEKAGRTLVSASRRDGVTLICVTLNAPSDWADHAALFDWGFSVFRSDVLVEKGGEVCTLPVSGSLVPFCSVTAERKVTAALKEGEVPLPELHLTTDVLSAPVRAGTTAGELIYFLDGEEIGRTDLVTQRDIRCDRAPVFGLWDKLLEHLK